MCSVTLRQSSIDDVVDAVASAGLACVEWGADVHVPPDNPAAATAAAARCRDRDVRVASYGSYFRAGVHSSAQFAAVLTSAIALAAPRIRIWAGDVGSTEASPEQRRMVAGSTGAAATRAADAGIELAFEFHRGTLTDSAESTVRLLEEVDHPAVRTYWQPPVGLGDAEAISGLQQVLPWVAAVHAFSWWPGSERLPLAGRTSLWHRVFQLLRGSARPLDVLLEFVRDDDPAQVRADAGTLARLLGGQSSIVG